MVVHEGHRERMRRRLSETDIEHLESHEVLEVLLYLVIPRGNTNELAHALEEEFETLENICNQPEEILMKIPGIGLQAAWFLHSLPAIFRFFEHAKSRDCVRFTDFNALGEYLVTFFLGQTIESVMVLLMNSKGRLLRKERLARGTVSAANIQLRALVELAMQYKATQMVLAHNHPSGSVIPSVDDITTTLALRKSLRELDICLIDHFVIAEKEFTSMAQNGLLR